MLRRIAGPGLLEIIENTDPLECLQGKPKSTKPMQSAQEGEHGDLENEWDHKVGEREDRGKTDAAVLTKMLLFLKKISHLIKEL